MRIGCQLERAFQVRRAGTWPQASFKQRPRPVRNHLGRVEIVFRAEAVARRASAVGRVEAERPRLELRHRDAAIGAGQFLRIHLLGAADHRHGHQAPRQLQRCGNRKLEALGDAGLHQQAVHNDFDGVVLALVQANRLVELPQFAIDARANEPILGEFFELLLVLAFAAPRDRREDHDAIFGLELQDGLDDLLGRLPSDGLAAVGAVRRPDRAIDHTQVIVDFGDSAYGRTRRARRRLLLDGDRRRKPLDGVHFGPLHLIEELPGVGGKRLDVAPLALGIDGVKRQR